MTKEEFQIGAEALRDHIVSIARHYLGSTDEVEDIAVIVPIADNVIKLSYGIRFLYVVTF